MNIEHIIKALSGMLLFEDLPQSDLKRLAVKINVSFYKKNTVVINKGEIGNTIHIIVFGSVKIYFKHPVMEETVLKIAGFGEIFGEMAILDGQPRSADVIALEDTQLFSLKQEDILQFLKRHPEVSLKLLGVMSTKVRNTNKLLLELRQMEDKLRYLGQHDQLTGLYNRAFFYEELQRYEALCFNPVGLIVCDVDGLKLINDSLGHNAGDMLLTEAASVIKKCFRDGDIVARIGGDEFIALLPNSSNSIVEDGYQRIQNAVTNYNLSKPLIPLSISVGFSVGNDPSTTMNELFKEADTNMYRQKLNNSRSARGDIVRCLMKTARAKDINDKHTNLPELVALLGKASGLSERNLVELDLLVKFHDIGNVSIPDHILFNQESLLPGELIEIQRHCEIGYRIALSVPELVPIADWILKHHECWNGKGYPLGLKGIDIPPECRILAICDGYIAMTSNLPSRKVLSHQDALLELKSLAGTYYDPELIEKFTLVIENWNPSNRI
ncbi:MAG: diguanylate cyclase domain-containing protein [Desulfitobacteriaceae bacterium]